jgi:hypothetical protein
MRGEAGIIQARRETERKAAVWSIGIFAGPTLTDLNPVPEARMPVLSAQDVSDVPASFVADPFMIKVNNIWHMFFEVMNGGRDKGEIGLATSKDGFSWTYQQIVLSEPFHLSYPYVFQAGGEYFMVPESYQANSMRLYRSDPFPLKWSYVGTLLNGAWVDSSIFHFKDRWWAFSSPVEKEHQVLELFHAFDLIGPWHAHPMSPLIQGNNRMARCAGRIVIRDGKPIRFTQDCFPVYGTGVRAFEVSVLTSSSYAEHELELSPILSAGTETWRRHGMHHIDPHFINDRWFACVDGWCIEGLEARRMTSRMAKP